KFMKKIIILLTITILIAQNNLSSTLYDYKDSGFPTLEQIFGDSQQENIDVENEKYHGIYDNWFLNNFNKQIALNDNIHPAILNKILKYYLNKNIDKINEIKAKQQNPVDTKITEILTKNIGSNLDGTSKAEYIKYNPVFDQDFDSKDILLRLKNKNAKIYCVGDIHAQYNATLQEIIAWLIHKKILGANFKLEESCYLVFQGDYTDRGYQGISVIAAIILLQIFNPEKVYILKGNHETLSFLDVPKELMFKDSVMAEALKLTDYDEYNTNLLLNHLELFYATLPTCLSITNPLKSKNVALICHGYGKNYWADVYPTECFKYLDDFYKKSVPSHRGSSNIYNAEYVIDEITKKNYSAIIKAHDHTISKKPERYITFDNEETKVINKNYEFELTTPSIGAVNIGLPGVFPIIVNIAGPIRSSGEISIEYLPTIVELTPNTNTIYNWKINAMDCSIRN
ncbi:metallophosphoesterase, partial [Candidatus Dependentiae bacterium]|nr:metallophosphoesterase [Candidatus Dependentiae bacterium]